MTQTLTTTTALDRLAVALHASVTALESSPSTPATIRPRVRTALVGGTPTRVQAHAGQHAFTIDEPATLGGDDTGASPVEHLLAALGSCQVISYQVWAARLGIVIDTIDIDVTGALDVRGFFGISDSVRPGFASVHVEAFIAGPETPERYAELTELVERYCPVLDILSNGVSVTSNVTHAA